MRTLPTGVEVIDHVLGGLTPGLPCVIAGPSGSGRTVLALQLAGSALDAGRVVSLLCNEPAPFLLQQAETLDLHFDDALESGRLCLLEMDSEIAATGDTAGALGLVERIRGEQPLTSPLLIDPFSVLTAALFDEARLRSAAREFVAAVPEWSVVLTVESERLALQQSLERILGEVCGAFLSLSRIDDGTRHLHVEKTRSDIATADLSFEISRDGLQPLAPEDDSPTLRLPGDAHVAGDEENTAPFVPAPTPGDPESADPPEPTRPERALVLLVDADPASRQRVAKWLEGRYAVDEAGDGFEAMTCLLMRKPDVVVLDLLMPRVTGYELLAAFQRSAQTIPRLVISGRVQRPGDRLGPLVLGATDILQKPVERIELIHKLETLLRLSEPPEELLDPLEAEALFASIAKSRRLPPDGFRDRLARACKLGERLGLPSSLLTVAADSSERLDSFLEVADATLRFEDASLRVSQRRAVLLLVATECADAGLVFERLCVRYEDSGGRPERLNSRVFEATRIEEGFDWHRLFREERTRGRR